MTSISVSIARWTILTCLIGAAIPFYFITEWSSNTSSASELLTDVALIGMCVAFPFTTPFVLYALSARTWRQNFKASIIVAVAAVVAVVVGNLVWRTYSNDSKDFDIFRMLVLVPPAQMLVYALARLILLVMVDGVWLAPHQ